MSDADPQDLPPTEDLVAFLSDPATHGLAAGAVRRVETHGAYVFLAGDDAYKMKKPIDLGFFDFTTLDKRETDSRREVTLNRRTAPDIYLGVVAVTREASGALALGGTGAPVEWLVHMRRFDETQVLDTLADDDPSVLAPALLDRLARDVAAFHRAAEPMPSFGGAAGMAEVVRSNAAQMAAFPEILPEEDAKQLTDAALAAVAAHGALLDARRETYVRRCHGDLHLGNIVLIDGRPVPFDCIEFSDAIACVDVLYDLAFLLMDLSFRGFATAANRVLNAYLMALDAADLEATLDGLAVLPLFLSCRAGVRAHIDARVAAAHGSDAERARLTRRAQAYLRLARDALAPSAPLLVAVGGLSGSGKSTLAAGLAPHLGLPPGAVVLRSDLLRKRAFDVAPTARLGDAAYTPEVNARVYHRQRDLAQRTVAAGWPVIADAVFARPAERDAIAEAAAADVRFDGLWLDVDDNAMAARIAARRGDASDATVSVLQQQLRYNLGPMLWTRIDGGGTPEAVLQRACAALGVAPSRRPV